MGQHPYVVSSTRQHVWVSLHDVWLSGQRMSLPTPSNSSTLKWNGMKMDDWSSSPFTHRLFLVSHLKPSFSSNFKINFQLKYKLNKQIWIQFFSWLYINWKNENFLLVLDHLLLFYQFLNNKNWYAILSEYAEFNSIRIF